MKLLLIVDDYLPHSIKVAAMMMHELAIELKKSGDEITVITPNPLQKKRLKEGYIDGIHILYFKSGRIKNIGKLKRALNETLLSFYAWRAAKRYLSKNTYNGIIYYSPTIFFGFFVKRLQKLWGCRSYLILRDVFPQWTVDNGLMNNNSFIHRYFKYFEKINYKYANKIGVMSPSNLAYFRNNLLDISKFEVLFNWAHLPAKQPVSSTFREELKLEKKIVFFYGGNIGHAQNMINLIDLAKQFINNKIVHFLFVGKGDEVDLILEEKKKQNLTNITYLPPVEQSIYFKMLIEFDIGIFSLHPNHKTHNFPGKLLGYMAYSKPILGCVNSGNDLKDIVNSAEAGIIVDSYDKAGLYNAANRLIESEDLRKYMGDNGSELLSNKFSVVNASVQIKNSL